jgi:hypothetical protein
MVVTSSQLLEINVAFCTIVLWLIKPPPTHAIPQPKEADQYILNVFGTFKNEKKPSKISKSIIGYPKLSKCQMATN